MHKAFIQMLFDRFHLYGFKQKNVTFHHQLYRVTNVYTFTIIWGWCLHLYFIVEVLQRYQEGKILMMIENRRHTSRYNLKNQISLKIWVWKSRCIIQCVIISDFESHMGGKQLESHSPYQRENQSYHKEARWIKNRSTSQYLVPIKPTISSFQVCVHHC